VPAACRLLAVRGSFEHPDEQRSMAGGRVTVDVVRLGELPMLRISHAPGWRWSEHTGPEVGLGRCHGTHVGLMLSGRMHVLEADGTEFEAGPGDVLAVGPGHDAWTVGDEPSVLVQLDEGESARRRFGL
jgi:quercetin dioxygenase-like cupin family protein